MSALTHISKKHHLNSERGAGSFLRASSLTEGFWFTLSFLLFVILGPFSAIPAFMAVMSLGNNEDAREPEAV